jgi:protoheme IX farnesyltransferase
MEGREPGERDGGEGTAKPGTPLGFLALIKPRVLMLLVFAGITGFATASSRQDGSWEILAWLLLGGFLATASANIFNNVLDRNRDSLMERTMWRPIPAGRVGPGPAAAIGAVLGVAGLLVLWNKLNLLTSILTLLGMLYYILVYTIVLKPRTYENITIGGVAGAFPPLVGWTSVTGELDWPPLVIGLMIILWTPPHFWSLSLFHREDYERAGFPMLPVVKGERATHVRIVSYAVLLSLVSLAYPYFDERMDIYYIVGWMFIIGPMLAFSANLIVKGGERSARRLFHYSNVFLAVLMLLIIYDSFFT